MPTPRAFVPILACAAMLACGRSLIAVSIYVPGASFESPSAAALPYARPEIDYWQKAPTPPGWTAQQWDNTAGVFLNIQQAWIDNVEGNQAAFLFSTPGVTLFQDLIAPFAAGQAYDLTVAIQGGGNANYGGPIKAGATMELRLYYRDAGNNPVTIGQTVVTNPQENYAVTHLTDYTLHIPAVTAQDAYAGKNIGVQLISTVEYANAGGYWDIDNVRLTSVPEPTTMVLMAIATVGVVRRRR
jgi:hypothetical protein